MENSNIIYDLSIRSKFTLDYNIDIADHLYRIAIDSKTRTIEIFFNIRIEKSIRNKNKCTYTKIKKTNILYLEFI